MCQRIKPLTAQEARSWLFLLYSRGKLGLKSLRIVPVVTRFLSVSTIDILAGAFGMLSGIPGLYLFHASSTCPSCDKKMSPDIATRARRTQPPQLRSSALWHKEWNVDLGSLYLILQPQLYYHHDINY